jgi:hypothetical protein
MNRFIVTVLIVVSLVVPTAAAVTAGTDDVDGKVELEPAGGPNGEYAFIEDGELRLDFGRLNDRATTRVDNVVTITATTDEPVKVWVETDLDGHVTAYTGSNPTAKFGQSTPRTLHPGESLSVGFIVDSHGDTPNTGTFTVTVVETDKETTDDDDTDDSSTGDETTDSTETPENTTETDTDVDDVTVIFDGEGIDANESINVTVRDSLPDDGPPGDPTAIIEPASLLSGEADGVVTTRSSAVVVAEGEPVTLTGTRSYIRTATAIATEPKPAAIVSITPPRELRAQPATVQIRVARDAFTETDPTEARIARHTAKGWQLLPTQVSQTTEETVVLEARTYGFSVFTVFPENQVAYQWTLPNGTTVAGDDLRTAFEKPGRYNVTLTVTDADGRSNRTQQGILVNDDPSVTIHGADNTTSGKKTTLHANVTNEIGNVTVTWTVPGGQTVVGDSLTRDFDPGATVRVSVEDEFGATDSAKVTIGAGADSGDGVVATVQAVATSLPAWVAVMVAVVAVAFAALFVRSRLIQAVAALLYRWMDVLRDAFVTDAPRVVFENATWNPTRQCIEIDELRVDAPDSPLNTIEITVTDGDGEVIVRKQIDVGTASTYTANPERIQVYDRIDLGDETAYQLQIRIIDDRNHVRTSQPTHNVRLPPSR